MHAEPFRAGIRMEAVSEFPLRPIALWSAGSVVLFFMGIHAVCRADTLFLSGTTGAPGTSVDAQVALLNERRITGMQFELRIPAGQAEAASALALEGMEKHRVGTRVVDGRLKVVVHSTTNADLPSGGVLSIPLELASGSPQGGPALSIENLIFTNAAGQSISGAVFYHPLEVWRQERFSEEQRDDPEMIGDDKDPDGDGFSNLEEFLFATNPLEKDPPTTASHDLGRRMIPVENGDPLPGPFVFSFLYPMAKGADGVELWIETSPDLVSWTRQSAQAVEIGGGDRVTKRMQLVMESDPAVTPRRFFRVGAARSESAVPQPGFVPKVSYEEWIVRHYQGDDLANPLVAGEQSDPDGDSLVNLMEYLFGSDPKVSSALPLPIAGLTVEGTAKTAVLKYGVSREAEGVRLLIEASTDLRSWSSVTSSDAPTGRASAGLVEIASGIPGQAPDRQFFRFQVVREP